MELPPAQLAGFSGTIKRRRRAIDRFRWVSGRDVRGFGYTPERDLAASDSALSTCDSEDHLESEGGESALLLYPVATATYDGPIAGRDVGGTMLGAIPQATATAPASCSIFPSSDSQVVFLERSAQEAPESSRPAQDRASVNSVVVLPHLPSSTGHVGDSSGSSNTSDDSSNNPSRTSLTDRLAPAAYSATVCDDAVASGSDDSDFHDAMDVGDAEVDPSLLAGSSVHSSFMQNDDAPRSIGGTQSATGEAAEGDVMQGMQHAVSGACEQVYVHSGREEVVDTAHAVIGGTTISLGRTGDANSTATLVMPAQTNEAMDEAIAVSVAKTLAKGTEVICMKISEVVPGELAVPDRLLLQTILRSWKQLVAKTGYGAPGSRGISINIPASNDESTLLSSTELPTLRGSHAGHLGICREPDVRGDAEVHWPPRYAYREARHLVSAPGLPSAPVPGSGDERCGFTLEWPAPSVKSLLDPAQLSLGQADNTISTPVPQLPTHGDSEPGQSRQSAHLDSACPKGLPFRILGELDEITETWASDVTMAAMVESNNDGSSDELVPLSAPSPPSSATATREASGVLLDSPQASFRGSLDHYLQVLNTSSSSPSTVRGRVRRGAMTRMSRRAPAERSAGEISNNLIGLTDLFAPEHGGDESGTDQEGPKASGVEDDLLPGYIILEGATLDNANLLPMPRIVVTDGHGEAAQGMKAAFESGSSDLSPTIASAAVVCPVSLPGGLTGSNPITIAPATGSSIHNLEASASYSLSGRCTADLHVPSAAESPKSDFEFGGSVPDATGSGSPTLLATTSVHNGSGVNLQTFVATDNSAATGSLPSDAIYSSTTVAQTPELLRPSSRTSSPSSKNSWSDPSVIVSPSRVLVTAPAARFQSPQQDLSQSVGSNLAVNPRKADSCLVGQSCFKQVPDGRSAPAAAVSAPCSWSASPTDDGGSHGLPAARGVSVSSNTSAASTSSRSSTDLPSFHQVASIGSWLDHFGSMLPQPSIGLQRSQAQHDPMVWFTQQMAQHDAKLGSAATPVALEGVGPGLRAPMHSPLNSFDDDRRLGINRRALASVTTTLFPAAHMSSSYPAPPSLSSASPRAHSRGGGPAVTSSSPLRSPGSASREQVTSQQGEFTTIRAQYAIPAAAGSALNMYALSYGSAEASIPSESASDLSGASHRTKRDELSVLLNSPRSPVSPVRVSRLVSPVVERRIIHPSQLASPEDAPGSGQSNSIIGLHTNLQLSPKQQHGHGNHPSSTAKQPGEGEAWLLPVALPSITTPQRELQGRPLAASRHISPPSALRNISSDAPLAIPKAVPGTGADDSKLDVVGIGATAAAYYKSRQPDFPPTSDSSSCPDTPTSRAAENASSPFRGPRAALRSSAPQLRSPPLTDSLITCASADDRRSFEESFEAAVRATPTRSPARSATGRGSVHVSPYSSPYKSALPATMSLCSSPGPGTPFRSLFLEEEEEEIAAGQLCEEDPMPSSPRATSLNVLFSLQAMDDNVATPGSVPVTSRDSGLPVLAKNPVFSANAALLWPQQQALPSVAGMTECQLPSNGDGVSTAMISPLTVSPCAIPGMEAVDYVQQTAKIQGRAAPDAPSPTSGCDMASFIPNCPVDISVTATESAAVADGQCISGLLEAKLESLPTLSCIPSLADTDDDGSASASPARAFTHMSEPNRQPRITLSGGLLVVPAVTSVGGGQLPKSNLSQVSTPQQEGEPEELAGEPSMGLPSIADIAAAASHETPFQIPQPGSARVICSPICPHSNDDGIGSGVGTFVAGCMTGGHGSAGSLASSATLTSRENSPPRSPAERTVCPPSSCPSASPVKLPLHSVHSPSSRSLAADGTPNRPKRDSISSAPDRPLPAVVSSFAGMAPVRTQPLIGEAVRTTASASAGQMPGPLPRRSGYCQAAREPWPAGPDEPLLATHASCPAGFVALSDRGLPPTPRSSRHDTTFSPSYGASTQSHDLYTQRSQQQQMWDRARAESRNASAAGTPRSARALFGTPQLPVSFSSSTCGYMEVCVSPVDAPRSPRAATSPARPLMFSQGAVTATSGSSIRDPTEGQSWRLQQARITYHASSRQDANQLGKLPPASPKVSTSLADQSGFPMEPPSPSWSQVSRRLFPEGNCLGGVATTLNTVGIAAPERRSVDQLDEVLAHMRVQVASPVSPQPRPPPMSPRLMSGGKGLSATVVAMEAAVASASTTGTGHWHPSMRAQASKAVPNEQDAPHVSPHSGTTRRASISARVPSAFSSSDAGTHLHYGQYPRGLLSEGGSHSSVAPVLPYLPPLPPLPRLRNLPRPPMVGSATSPVDPMSAITTWPCLPFPASDGGACEPGRNVVVEAGHHRPFRQSAPELSQLLGPLSRGNPTHASSIPGMPTAAEQDPLMALESQFKAAEREAADLPIETRVATPTTLPQAVTNNYALAMNDVPPAGLPVDAPEAGSSLDNYAVSHVTLLSPRAAPPVMAPIRDLGISTGPVASGNLGVGGATMTSAVRRVEEMQADASALYAETSVATGGRSVARHRDVRLAQGQAEGGDSSMTITDLKHVGHGTTVSDTKESCPSTMSAVHDSLVPHINGDASGRSGSQCQQERGNSHHCYMPQNAAAPRSGLQWTAHSQVSGATVTAPADTLGNPAGNRISPAGSISGDPHIAPCARYMGQYLVPAAQVTADPRVGPAVWIVSTEEELAGALSRLLHDTVERQSRGRAAAQGAAKLASSLVTTVWNVLEDMVIAPALQDYITSRGIRVPT
ncbi:hypothetical protein Vretifemale_5404 [Volvox reticuliferus]|nr:hypothetical protein Vretifemale_5404 [Volvox reticuliferus]